MKKTIFAVMAITMLLSVNVVAAKGDAKGQPFNAIWKAINNLQSQINHLDDDDDDDDHGTPTSTPSHAHQLSMPDYDSGWLTVPGATTTVSLNHNLNANVNNYVVDSEYKASSSLNVISSQESADNYLWWTDLTSNTIKLQVTGDASDHYASARIRIWETK